MTQPKEKLGEKGDARKRRPRELRPLVMSERLTFLHLAGKSRQTASVSISSTRALGSFPCSACASDFGESVLQHNEVDDLSKWLKQHTKLILGSAIRNVAHEQLKSAHAQEG